MHVLLVKNVMWLLVHFSIACSIYQLCLCLKNITTYGNQIRTNYAYWYYLRHALTCPFPQENSICLVWPRSISSPRRNWKMWLEYLALPAASTAWLQISGRWWQPKGWAMISSESKLLRLVRSAMKVMGRTEDLSLQSIYKQPVFCQTCCIYFILSMSSWLLAEDIESQNAGLKMHLSPHQTALKVICSRVIVECWLLLSWLVCIWLQIDFCFVLKIYFSFFKNMFIECVLCGPSMKPVLFFCFEICSANIYFASITISDKKNLSREYN